ncbi:tetratricopeptide repeat protein [Actinoplanes palleronii]|uniref:Tetratricopeptide repeat protein n=1 Tax=Actinoplanes palleronii TaxID=113570 RepID=A0ABQ4BI10_9ACTN|nr:tetratricopeptide repeat protein [Actinoplanes palleronii]GIE70324.1 tetratricopeptide repeat protein [Actinoplanes palleronii]
MTDGKPISIQNSQGVQVGNRSTQINISQILAGAGSAPEAVNPPGGTHNLPHPAGSVFVGRAEAMATLSAKAESGDVIGQTLHGLGGVGKIELALQFAHAHRERYSLVWWITADTPERVALGLVDLTRRLHPEVTLLADAAEWALGWLQNHTGWLLILDNVEDPADITTLLGQIRGQGSVLMTTRRDLGELVWTRLRLSPLRLSPLDRAASLELLSNLSGSEDTDGEADLLAEELGDLPLALDQAAAYIGQRGIAFAEYRRRLARFPKKMYATVPEGFPAERALHQVWALTMETVAERSQIAPRLLLILAFFAPDALPETVLDPAAKDPLDVEDALALLASYSMITRTARTLSVHRLVQAVSRTQTGGPAAPLAAVGLLARAISQDPFSDVNNWPRWNALLPHIDAVSTHLEGMDRTDTLAALLDRTATYLENQGAFDQATSMFESLFTDLSHTLGAYHPRTLVVGHNLAHAHQSAGRPAAAIRQYERILAIAGPSLGGDHSLVLNCRDNLAHAYTSVGRPTEAITILEANLVDFRRIYGEPNPHVSACRSFLAQAYQEVGRSAESVQLLEHVLADEILMSHENHPGTLTARNNLAQAYLSIDRLADAIQLFAALVPENERLLGEKHPDTLTARMNFADTYRKAGQAHEAIPLLEAVIVDYREVLGEAHPSTLICQDNLASAYQFAGKFDRAIPLFEITVAELRRVLGDDHPTTRISKSNLAYARQQAGQQLG